MTMFTVTHPHDREPDWVNETDFENQLDDIEIKALVALAEAQVLVEKAIRLIDEKTSDDESSYLKDGFESARSDAVCNIVGGEFEDEGIAWVEQHFKGLWRERYKEGLK